MSCYIDPRTGKAKCSAPGGGIMPIGVKPPKKCSETNIDWKEKVQVKEGQGYKWECPQGYEQVNLGGNCCQPIGSTQDTKIGITQAGFWGNHKDKIIGGALLLAAAGVGYAMWKNRK